MKEYDENDRIFLYELKSEMVELRKEITNLQKLSEPLTCSFCGKSDEDVERMIAGAGGATICYECVELCMEIVEEKRKEK